MKQATHANCSTCPLRDDSFTQVPSYGPNDPRLIVVGEGPGAVEAFMQRPFVGDTGTITRNLLTEHGYDPATEVYWTNATMCWPKGLSKKDKEAALEGAIAACKGRLQYALSKFPDTTPVLGLGSWACKALDITQDRWQTEGLTGKPTIGTAHPAYAMHTKNGGPLTMVDRVMKKLAAGWQGQLALPLPYLIDDVKDIPKSTLGAAHPGNPICIDIERSSTDWWQGETGWIGISMPALDGDISAGTSDWIFTPKVIQTAAFARWFLAFYEHNHAQIGGHNFKFDALCLNRGYGTPLKWGWDTMLMVNILDTFWHKKLKTLAGYYFNIPDWGETIRATGLPFTEVDPYVLIPYLHRDVHYNLLLYYELRRELEGVGRWDTPYQKYEMPLSMELAQMEKRGFSVDLDRVEQERVAFGEDIIQLTTKVQELSNNEIKKPGSYKQVAEHLYSTLDLKHSGKGMAPTCTAEGALITLDAETYPIVQAIREYRRVSKLSSSYLKNLPPLTRRTPRGLVLCSPSAKQAHVLTGRLSFTRPAIQTIPKRNDAKDAGALYGERIKACYVARPGYILVFVDGSQWEMRVATCWSQDPWLLDAYRSELDVHDLACDMMYDKEWDQAMRTKEKNIMFGSVMYGGTLEGVIAKAGVASGDARKVNEFFTSKLGRMYEWQEEMYQQARSGCIVSPFFNRAYHFHLITKHNQADVRRFAVNWPVQGTASNITLEAAVRSAPYIRELGGGMVATVHDSNGAEVPIGQEQEAARIMCTQLETVGAAAFPDIPWRADAEIGYRWGEMQEYDWREV